VWAGGIATMSITSRVNAQTADASREAKPSFLRLRGSLACFLDGTELDAGAEPGDMCIRGQHFAGRQYLFGVQCVHYDSAIGRNGDIGAPRVAVRRATGAHSRQAAEDGQIAWLFAVCSPSCSPARTFQRHFLRPRSAVAV
jgi:hypothetical protein